MQKDYRAQAPLRLLATLFFLVVVTGCGTLKETIAHKKEAVFDPERQFNSAVTLLEEGEEYKAKQKLIKILSLYPKNIPSKKLLEQIEQPPMQRYGNNFFEYRVQTGDTIGHIAQKFLGSYLEFYGLAKYNDISRPKDIRVGQTLKIPYTQRTDKEIQKEDKEQLNKNLENAKIAFSEDKFIETLNLLSQIHLNNKNKDTTLNLFNEAEKRIISQLKSNQLNIKQLIQLINEINPTNTMRIRLDNTLTILKYWDILKSAISAFEQNQTTISYDLYLKALSIRTDQTEESENLKSQLSEKLHRSAVLHYRGQDLERAIHLWDKVLKINPDHESAKSYWTRATELNAQLKNVPN
ncbi:LysM peptidoglycan-binding domain-containing protein [Pleionea sediminis]|uniref:LysM peptidoglycan-binding domain-containing protein n=1 Tax=Pleionea sediminis TaxID=2569479 RepID=UPI001185331A|nr:LysM peptidoglycan-binding domain-containing protein [Pleionea sediminis]